ncbi:MAG: hypothetical protein ACRCTZ_03500 [Sarcina sp.]
MRKNNFRNLMKYEIEKNFTLCVAITGVILLAINIYLGFVSASIKSNWGVKSLAYIEQIVLDIERQFEIATGIGNVIVYIGTVFFISLILLKEWNGKNKTSYTLLSLPVSRWKLLVSKLLLPIGFLFINYAIKIFSFSTNIKLLSNYINTEFDSKVGADYLIYNFEVQMSTLNESYIFSDIAFGLTLITFAFLVFLSSKSFGNVGLVISLIICVGVILYSIFASIIFGMLLNDRIPYPINTFIYVLGIVATLINFILIKKKVAV